MAGFDRSLAVVIGINEYQHEPKLQTARYDAERLAEILVIEQDYNYVILVTDETYKEYRKREELGVKNKYQPTLNGLRNLLSERLPQINPTQEDRLLFYYAGHGIPKESDEGPKGYLVPLDADSKKRDSLLPMQELYKYLAALNCRHFLIIIDCCFAGMLRWSSTRKGRTFPRVIHQEHYERFINSTAWQAIASASHDQEAFDTLRDNRGTVEGTNHSPFAQGLFEALKGKADVIPVSEKGQPAGDGVITATELYMYLEAYVAKASKGRQTPGKWDLPKHVGGEYIFLAPGAELKLKPAPNVNEKNNPYRGLESFDEEHSQFFFGREELIQQLSERISAPKQPLTVVLGVSGSGKSSLVKAGLIPYLKKLSQSEVFEVNCVSAYTLTSAIVQAFPQVPPKFWPINYVHQWCILNPMRPGESPFTALAKTVLALADITGSNQPDTLNFLNVSKSLDNLTFLTKVLEQKVKALKAEVDKSSFENGEESSETLRLQKEVDQFNSITERWKQGTQKAKQLLIVGHFEELYTLCRNPAEKQQLQQAVSDCLNPLSLRLQSDPNQLIDIVRAWIQKNPGVRLLLTIDQFEELITLSRSEHKDKQNNQQQQQKKLSNQPTQAVQQGNKLEEWQQFLNLLEKTLSANLEQLRILVTLRSDFEPRFLNSDALKSHWTKARFPVRAMRSDELRQAIERPASEMALYFEPPNLVDKLIDEVGQMPGALPLLSFTLSQLYIKLAQKWRLQETSARALTLDADFDKQGGVAGSLTRRANEEYDKLPNEAHRATLRRVMLRMVTFEGGELARRRVPESELEYADAAENERVKLIRERFNHARLIVSGQETGEPYVEPAHDFLVRSWDKLQNWQQEEQEDLPLQRRLTPVAIEWKSKKQSSSLLGKSEPFLDWCDKRIDSVEDWLNQIKKDDQQSQPEKKRQFLWNGNPYLDVLKRRLKSYDHWFNQVETKFVQQSVWQRRRNINLRWFIAIVVFIGLSSLTIAALIGQRNALMGQIRATRQSAESNLPNQELDALLDSLRAGKSLKDWPGYLSLLKPESKLPFLKPDPDLQPQVLRTLRKISYVAKERNRITVPQGFNKMFFAPDGTLQIATVGSDGIVHIQDSKGNKRSKVFSGHKGKVTLDVNRDSSLLASIDEQGTVRLWNLEGIQEELPKLVASIPQSTFSKVDSSEIEFSPDGKKLVAFVKGKAKSNQKSDGITYLWDLSGNETKLLKHARGYFSDINFNFNNQLIVATQPEFTTIYLSDFMSGKRLADLSAKYFIADCRVKFYFTHDNISAASCSNTVIVKKLDDESPWKDFEPAGGEEKSINFDAIGRLIVRHNYKGTISIYDSDLSKDKLQLELKGHQGEVDQVISSSNGKRFASKGSDNTIRLWDIEDKPVTQLRSIPNLTSVSVSPDGKQLAVVESDGTVRLLDLNANELKRLVNVQGKISQIVFSPVDQKLAAVGKDSTIRLLDLNGKELCKSQNFEKPINQLIFSPNGQQLAFVENDNTYEATIYLLNLNNKPWKPSPYKFSPTYKMGSYQSITFSSDSKSLLVAGPKFVSINGPNRTSFSLKELESNKELANFESDTFFSKISLNTKVSLLASKSDESIYLWDMSGKLLTSFKSQQLGEVTSISLSADGSLLATLSEDGTARLWRIGDFDELLEQGCDQVRDHLATLDEKSSDRHLCDGIPPSTPSPQTTIANSSTPSIVQPSAQNAPSPAPASNNGQDTPSSSAPANAPARPQNVPSPTPASNNGQNNNRQAPSDRNQASKLNSTSVETYIKQGLTYHRQRNYQQAISSYSKALALNPNSAKAYSNRAAAYNEQKDYQKAIADSSKAISLNPNYVNAYINRGLAYYHQGNYQQAIANYNKAIELAPGNANAYNNRGLAYTRLGNQQAAQADKRKAAALSQRQSQ